MQLRPARDQLLFRSRARIRRRPLHLQERGHKGSCQGGALDLLYAPGSQRNARATPVTSTLSSRGEDGNPVFPEGHEFSETFEHFIAGQVACLREFMLFFAPNVNSSYKRYAKGSWPPPRSRGARTTVPVLPRRRARQLPARRESYPGRGRQPLPGHRGHDRRRVARDRERATAGQRVRRQRLRDRRSGTSRPTCARRRTSSRVARRPRAFGDEVVEHYLKHGARGDRCLLGGRVPPTGSATGTSSACEPKARPTIGVTAATENVSLARLERGSRLQRPRELRAGRPRGRRAPPSSSPQIPKMRKIPMGR